MEYFNRRTGESWGDNAGLLKLWAPTIADEPGAQELWNRTMVFCGTPATAVAWLEMVRDTDVRATLPAIGVPTLVLGVESPHPESTARAISEACDA